ncbi:MAG: cell division protein FtsZ [Fusobacteriaceae bacterium]|jgi:cell division protein FtsZ|nr:cell division protein FtsZ [Fusobacteriaceae bacterium]
MGMEEHVKIKVIGVGGAGGNAINDMIASGVSGIEFIAANTDVQDLENSAAQVKLQLGKNLTKGLGAGADPEIGRKSVEESKEEVKKILENTDMLFITAGMGGGTGTGAAPSIAEIAKELDVLTIGIVTKPFNFEGKKRMKNAEEGLARFREHVDTLVIIPNDKLFELPNKKITLKNAFQEANNILKIGVKGVSDLITKHGYINLDFADIRTVIKNSGVAMLGFGEASGEDRASIATQMALSNPLLEKSIKGAQRILLNITGGEDFALTEANQISEAIKEAAGTEHTEELMFGSVIDESLDDVIKVTIMATDFLDLADKDIKKEKIIDSSIKVNKEQKVEEDDDYLEIPAIIRKRNL